MNKRRQKTRKAVLDAFEQLLSEKKYEDITIQEISDRAHIGRTTFYASFDDKDSLLDGVCSDLFDHIFAQHLHEEKTHDFSRAEPTENSRLTHILYHLRERREQCTRLFSGRSGDIFWQRFIMRFEELLKEETNRGRWKPAAILPDNLYQSLYTGAFVQTVRWWFSHECQESPEQIVKYFHIFIMHAVE